MFLGRQYVTITDDYGHEEEDLEENEYPDIEFHSNRIFDYDTGNFIINPKFNKYQQHSTMSPAPKPTKTLLKDVGLGSKRKGNEPIEILDDENNSHHHQYNQKQSIAIDLDDSFDSNIKSPSKFNSSVNNSVNNSIVIDLDSDEEKENQDFNQSSVLSTTTTTSTPSIPNIQKATEIRGNKDDSLETIRKQKNFNFLVNRAKESELKGNKTESLHYILDAEEFARNNNLGEALIQNDEVFKHLVKRKFKEIVPPSN
ncbi:hypothetical protein ACTFIY_001956 [Dictyostelium cf. discoideum]